MENENKWQWLRKVLVNLTDDQLKELFHDLGDDEAVKRFGSAAFDFICLKYEIVEDDQEEEGQSEFEEAREIDNARRYREYQSDNRRWPF